MGKELFNEPKGGLLAALSPAALPSALRSPSTPSSHPGVHRPRSLHAAACACLYPCQGCERCPVPVNALVPTRQEHSGKLNFWLLLGQLPKPEPQIQLRSGVNPPSCPAAASALTPGRPSSDPGVCGWAEQGRAAIPLPLLSRGGWGWGGLHRSWPRLAQAGTQRRFWRAFVEAFTELPLQTENFACSKITHGNLKNPKNPKGHLCVAA